MAAPSGFFHLLLTLLLVCLAGNHPTAVEAVDAKDKLIMVDLLDYGPCPGTLALRLDTLHVAGFANRTRHWHALRGNEHLFRDANLTATPLPFSNTYDDLVGGVSNLDGLPIAAPSQKRAAAVLSGAGYDDDDGGEAEATLKRALATFMVVIGEGQRLRCILETLLSGFDARVKAEHLPYIEHWGAMWEELTRWRRSGGVVWGTGPFAGVLREKAGIGSAEDALAVIGVSFRHMLLRGRSMPVM